MALPIKNTGLEIDDVYLHKFIASEKIKKVIDFVDEHNSSSITKTASMDKDDLITLFANMASTTDAFLKDFCLQQLNLSLRQSEIQNTTNGFAYRGPQNNFAQNDLHEVKTAKTVKDSERKSDIKIVSKSIKDSHYQVDVSKDMIKHKGRNVFMVSCYARDAYLGRYLIKRNYFYTMEREASADSAFDEITTKIGALKNRYYEDILDVSGIFTQAKQILDGVVSEVEFSEDSLGTTVSR